MQEFSFDDALGITQTRSFENNHLLPKKSIGKVHLVAKKL